MPVPGFDGNGNYVRKYSWVTDRINGVPITSSEFDTEDNGFGAGLSLCVTRDGQGKMAADFTPAADATYNLGTGGLRWASLTVSGEVTSNTLAVGAGGASINGALVVNGQISQQGFTTRASTTLVKAANTPRASNTSATPDPDLQLPLTPGTYAFEAWITDGNSATSPGGLKGTIAYTGTFTSTSWGWGMVGSGTNTTNVPMVTINVTAQQMQTAQGGVGNMWITGSIVVTGNGTLSFSWAQNSSNGTASIVSAGSWMRITKLA